MNSKGHKNHISGVFTRMASIYDQVGFRYFSHFGKRLVELTGISEKAKVLDIATGRGASLFPAIKKVGSEGSVVGIDISEGMVQKTENEIKNQGISNAKVVQMDAENLTFENNSFDFALCGLSIFFFPQYNIALKEAFRVLKLGGKIGISTFAKKLHDELEWLWPLLQKYVSPKKEEKQSGQKISSREFDTTKGTQSKLIKAGFRDIYHEIEEKRFVCQNAEELWKYLWSIYSRATLEKISPSGLGELTEEIKRNYNQYYQDNELFNTVRVLFTFGIK